MVVGFLQSWQLTGYPSYMVAVCFPKLKLLPNFFKFFLNKICFFFFWNFFVCLSSFFADSDIPSCFLLEKKSKLFIFLLFPDATTTAHCFYHSVFFSKLKVLSLMRELLLELPVSFILKWVFWVFRITA